MLTQGSLKTLREECSEKSQVITTILLLIIITYCFGYIHTKAPLYLCVHTHKALQLVVEVRGKHEGWFFHLTMWALGTEFQASTLAVSARTHWAILLALFCLSVWGMFSCSPGWPGTFYITKDYLELLILLPVPPEGGDYWCAPPRPVYVAPGTNPRASALPTEPRCQPWASHLGFPTVSFLPLRRCLTPFDFHGGQDSSTISSQPSQLCLH